MRTLKQVATNMADAFTRFGLWKGGGSDSLNVEITELWSGQQSSSSEITLSDDYANYDVIISMTEPLEDYPTQQKFDFMLKGAESLTGGIAENNSYIASYRLNNWNGTSVYFRRDNNPSDWNFTLRKIWGIKFVSQLHEYSTEEKVVGKWIDGKPIYEKTFEIGAKSSNYTFTIENLDKIINYTGNCIISSYSRIIPFIQTQYNNFVIINDYKDGIVTLATNLSYTDCILVIQYTKTTD